MSRILRRYFATDKEVFDVLVSAKQRISFPVLHDLAKARGIFYSPSAPREFLASRVSMLTHDFESLQSIMGQSESPSRAEKMTSVVLKEKLTMEDVKEVCATYGATNAVDEKVVPHQSGDDKFLMKVRYSELDFSRTTLMQRREREAAIEFVVGESQTTIRMPASLKAKMIVNSLKDSLDARLLKDILKEEIDLSEFTAPDYRTRFFTSLISNLDGFTPQDVTSVKVHSKLKQVQSIIESLEDDEDETADEPEGGEPEDSTEDEGELDDETADAKEEMRSVVENVALKGQSLLASTEYQELKKKGFFISAIIWKSQEKKSPYNVYEFEAEFEQPEIGKAFKYNVRGIFKNRDGLVSKTLHPLTPEHKQEIFPVIEQTARAILQELRNAAKSVTVTNTEENPA